MINAILNLDVGPTDPGLADRTAKFGSIDLRLVSDYPSVVRHLASSTRFTIGWAPTESSPILRRTVLPPSETPPIWIQTAEVRLDNASGQESILSRNPLSDGGVWDVTQILTFLTGRRVTTSLFRDRYNPGSVGDRACSTEATLRMATWLWDRREALRKASLVYAFILYNGRTESRLLHEIAANTNTAINILIDKLSPVQSDLPASTRSELKKAVLQTIDSAKGLAEPELRAYKAIIGARIDQGPVSLHDGLLLLLKRLNILEPFPKPGELSRVAYINTARNRITHSGQLPLLRGLDQEQSDRYIMTIVAGVLPAIIRAAIWSVAGVDGMCEQWHALELRELKRFFSCGEWQSWKLEEQDAVEWAASLR